MNSKQQGAIGVAQAVAHFTSLGYAVFTPISDVSRFDLVVEKDTKLYKVEVKTTTRANGEVSLRTLGGNQSWSGVVKKMSSFDCDIVFMYNLSTKNATVMLATDLHNRSSIKIK